MGRDPGPLMAFRARWVLPMARDPIENGLMVVEQGRIASVSNAAHSQVRGHSKILDLGDAIVLPGLINAHCHLDFTDLAGKIPSRTSFVSWAQNLMQLREGWGTNEFKSSWERGAKMLLHSGTTTVTNIETQIDLLPELWSSTPLRVGSFLEVTNVKSGRAASEVLDPLLEAINALSNQRGFVGLSPHASYSCTGELLQLAVVRSREKNLRLTTHVAESQEEMQMFQDEEGMLFEWLKSFHSRTDCGNISPVGYLHKLGMLGPRFLAVHANYLRPGDAELLGQSGSHVVHCPQSHAFFGYAPFHWAELTGAKVNLCLGTDSLASIPLQEGSSPGLDLFAEMQFLYAQDKIVPQRILQMATVNGARALGLQGEIGELSVNAKADFIAIPFADPGKDLFESVIQHRGPLTFSMIDGTPAEMPSPRVG